MAYEKPITIKEAITSIQEQEFILPAIQREFVWNTKQIELLFDSILRDYPISTFLFWKVKADNIEKFKFYRFLPYYHERDKKHNDPAELSGDKDRFAILDGQQRLTSLYIGLKGSYSFRLSRHRKNSTHAYPKKHLYINLLADSEDTEFKYDIRFLSDDEVSKFKEQSSHEYFWLKIGYVLDFKDIDDILSFISQNSLMDSSKYTKEQMQHCSQTLSKLYKYLSEKEMINFYLEKSDELDKVLHIFIRVNSGGTKLSYSDLLLSIATAQWQEKDAREIIHKFVDQMNLIGSGFNVNKDLVLKSCLVLADIKDIKFKVENFTAANMKVIEDDWQNISRSFELALRLISSFGFSENTLTAYNAIIPIAYFIRKNNFNEEILSASVHSENRRFIKEWLIRALLKRIFGGTPDSLYPIYRTMISENLGKFPLEKLIDRYKGTNKSLSFDEDTVDHLLLTQYGGAFTYMVLSLLYPLDHHFVFHQDHIHPKSYFTHTKLEEAGISDSEKRGKFLESYNCIGNLQLIQETQNLEKNAKPFADWLNTNYSGGHLDNYKNLHLIPLNNDLSMAQFLDFYDKRRSVIKSKLMLILNVDSSVSEEVVADIFEEQPE
jgi:uncharacterized protein with ParB-like and HNH nuclease domain